MQGARPAPAPSRTYVLWGSLAAFSCQQFDAHIAAAVAVEYFGGAPRLRVLQR